MKTLYAIPWYNCNLSCKHCEISKMDDGPMSFEFMEALKNTDAEEVTLFGGEPLLNKYILKEILNTGKITSISTNMLLYTDDIGQMLAKHNINIATSWNPTRFRGIQYYEWLANIEKAVNLGLKVMVLITLTPDLFAYPMKRLLFKLEDMELYGCESFLFEPLVAETEVHEQADEWLCEFHKQYEGKMINEFEKKLDKWCHDCSEVYTLKPSGTIVKGCPHGLPSHIIDECITCERASYCQPCRLLKTCSYPKKLRELCLGL